MSNWAKPRDGDFNVKKNWISRKVPDAQHDAILDAAGRHYTVSITTFDNARSIQTASNATLSITDGFGLTAFAGTGTGANAGAIVLGDGSTLGVNGGVIDNTGLISLNAGAKNTFLSLATSTVTLEGGGSVVLSDNAFNGIADRSTGDAAGLVNVDNTISGAGFIGSGGLSMAGVLTVVNGVAGVIDATGALNALRINTPGATFTNSGLLEATGAAGLDIAATTVDGSGGGVILAATGSIVRLESAMIISGTLNTAGTGVVEASGGSALDGSASTVHNQGELKVIDGDSLTATGVIDNTGAIALAGTSSGSALVLSGNLTLQGGGGLSLADFPGSLITGPTFSDTLTNVDNTIAGDGQIGGGQITLVNQSKGFIEETGASGLTLDTGSTAIINAGEIRALGSGGMLIQSAVTNSGVIAADGAGALTITAKVKNTGLLEVNGGTLIDYEAVSGSGSAAIAAGNLESMSNFNQDVAFTGSSGTLELAKSQAYTATIAGFSQSGGTFLDLADIKFTGHSGQASFTDNGSHTGGVLTVTDGIHTARINLVGDYHASTFVVTNDGNGKVLVHDPAAPGAALTVPRTHPFIAAMAGLGAHLGGPAQVANDAHFVRPAMLAVPRMAMA